MLSIAVNAQVNLVANGDFEQYDTCPDNGNQMHYCTGWSNAGDSTNDFSTSDYFNTCSSFPPISPPIVAWGYQFPHSGNAYCFVATFRENYLRREYIQTELVDTLIPNVTYYVSFYASLAGGPGYLIATNKIGALFTKQKFEAPNFAVPINFAHVYSDSIITDTLNWYHFKASFVADSNYRYVTIGNFFDDAHTDTIDLGGIVSQFGGYFIDDVCISTDSTLCYTPTSVIEMHQSGNSIYPNPANDVLSISINSHKGEDVVVYDVFGRIILFTKMKDGNTEINCSHWAEGLYFIKISQQCFKIIIKH